MKSSLWSRVFFTVNLIALPAFAADVIDWKHCQVVIEKMRAKGKKTHETLVRNRVGANAAKTPVLRVVPDGLRDMVRRGLQRFNSEPYPFVKRNDTPIAIAFGKSAAGLMNDVQKNILDVKAVQDDLSQTLAKVQAYPKAHSDLIDAAANAAIEKVGLKHAKNYEIKIDDGGTTRTQKAVSHKDDGIPVMLPHYKDGELQEAMRTEYYGNSDQLRIEAGKGLNKEIARLSSELKALEAEQASNTQKLEIYVHEIRRYQSLNPSYQSEDAFYAKFLDDVDALYASGRTDGNLKDDYTPPYETWNAWKWRAFFRQAWTVGFKVTEKFVTKDADGNIVQDRRLRTRDQDGREITPNGMWDLINSLTERDLRAKGLHNLVDSWNIIKKAQWTRFLWPTVAVLFGGGVYGEIDQDDYGRNLFVGWAKAWLANWNHRQDCVEAKTEDEFASCLNEYLSSKYPKEYVKNIMLWDELVYNGDIVDPNIAADIDEIVADRQEYNETLATGQLVQNAIKARALNSADPTTQAFRDALIKNSDEGYVVMRLTSKTPGVGYFATRFPYQYQNPEIRALVRFTVENRESDQAKSISLAMLRDHESGNGAEVAKALDEFLRDWQGRRSAEPMIEDIEKAIEEAISVERGIEGD